MVFFNAPYFKRRAQTQVDVTGIYALDDIAEELHRHGAELVFAGRCTEVAEWLERRRLADHASQRRHFPTLRQAVRAYRIEHGAERPEPEPQAPLTTG